jgi:hypothetical protein
VSLLALASQLSVYIHDKQGVTAVAVPDMVVEMIYTVIVMDRLQLFTYNS